MGQYSELTMLRANLMGGMNRYILDNGDENIFDIWFSTFPDECDEEELMEIAQAEYCWLDVVQCFARCVRCIEGTQPFKEHIGEV